jgi:lipopolysaccharide biosynthesis glycosyltransferase
VRDADRSSSARIDPRFAADVLLMTAADERVATQAVLALLSAARSTSRPVRCVLLADEVHPSQVAHAHDRFEAAGIPFEIVAIDPAPLEGLRTDEPWGRAANARLLLTRELHESAPRTLYLDTDTLTVGSLDELLDVDLQGMPLAAVADETVPVVSAGAAGVVHWRALGIPPATAYFNSGVLLIDNERWEAERLGERTMELLRDYPREGSFPDQGALNAAIAGRWLPVDARWNLQIRGARGIAVSGWVLSRAGVSRAREGAILHFTGGKKPWHRSYARGPARDAYIAGWKQHLPDIPFPM